MQCRLCTNDILPYRYGIKDDQTLCDACHMRLYGRFGRCGHALHGLSDGPSQSYVCFEKPNRYEETRLQLAAMEASGKLKDPEMMAKAQGLLAAAKEYRDTHSNENIDYDKEGHALDG